MSSSQTNKLKSRIKHGTEVASSLSSDVVDNVDDETNFPGKLLLADTQFSRLWKALANGLTQL